MAETSTMEKGASAAPSTHPPSSSNSDCLLLDAILRLLLLASSIIAVVVMVTGNETQLVYSPLYKGLVPAPAKFRYSPAFVYFVVALSVAGLYSIITGLLSLSTLTKRCTTAKTLFLLAIYDLVMLGIVASATGTAGGVAYVGLKGNSHVNWGKICHLYGKFCRHVGASTAVALFASVLLLLLVMVNAHALYRRAEPKS